MSQRTEIFTFDLKDKVTIKATKSHGVIEGLIIDYHGPQYYVRYWDGMEQKKVYLPADELEERA